jgi:hypothetical protein
MQAAPAPIPRQRRITSSTRLDIGIALIYSTLALATLVFLLPSAALSTPLRWHLPWPILQWALTTPIGNLSLFVLRLLVAGPPFILFMVWVCRRMIARASDVTEMPIAAGANRCQARLHLPLLQRWLGVGRGAQSQAHHVLPTSSCVIARPSRGTASCVSRLTEVYPHVSRLTLPIRGTRIALLPCQVTSSWHTSHRRSANTIR